MLNPFEDACARIAKDWEYIANGWKELYLDLKLVSAPLQVELKEPSLASLIRFFTDKEVQYIQDSFVKDERLQIMRFAYVQDNMFIGWYACDSGIPSVCLLDTPLPY